MAEAGLIESALLAQHGFTGLFTRRTGGISPPPFDSLNFGTGLGDDEANIQHNLNILLQQGRLPHPPHQAKQVHGTTMLLCNGTGIAHHEEADILISEQVDTAVAIRTADCLPVLLADPDSGIVAAVHAGWRGTAANVVSTAIARMSELGAKPAGILASLGPCIGACCFQIDKETADILADSAEGTETFISRRHSSRRATDFTADLAAMNAWQCRQSGLLQAHIERLDQCTACHGHDFFSFRRDHGHTGRHLAVVARLSNT